MKSYKLKIENLNPRVKSQKLKVISQQLKVKSKN